MKFAATLATALSLAISIPALAGQTRNVIYENDDRVEIADVKDFGVLEAARSTSAMITMDYLTRAKGGYTSNPTSMGKQLHLCPDERFADQPSSADCSSVLVGPKTILTAGHCVSKSTCSVSAFVFGYQMDRRGKDGFWFPDNDVYFCKEVLDRSNRPELDYAVVELDRPVVGRTPVKISPADASKGDSVYLLSYPGGVPLKFTPPVSVNKSRRDTFNADLDDQAGSSGGPVFKAGTNELLGILVSGPDDYVRDHEQRCKRIKHCEAGECDGEDSTHVSVALKYVDPNVR